MRKSTQELVNEIKNTEDIEQYLSANEDNLDTLSLANYLNEMLEKYAIDKAQVFRKAEMSGNNYGYEMFQGDRKNVSRDKILQVCMGFPLSLDEAQYALRCGKVGALDPRDRRDSLVMMAIHKGYSVNELNELLDSHHVNLLF